MMSPTSALREAGSSTRDLGASRLGPRSILVLSAWCGLVSGLLEVGTIVLRKQIFDINHFYWKSRHFIWLIPLTSLGIFLAVGVVLSLAVPWRRGRWLAPRLLGALMLLPAFWAAFPEIHSLAGLLLVLGATARSVPTLERHAVGLRRLVRVSFPVVAGLVAILAASVWVGDRIKRWREESRPLPPPGSPNVLLIVLDTVAAGHLSLHGYHRPTSPTLDELARRGIRFDRAQATSPWTLLSHAGMLTGRWPHELSAGWLTPLDGTHPTMAEFLGSRGYATAGFAANYTYCASDSGLSRGFTTYRDYMFPRLTAFKTTVLVDRLEGGFRSLDQLLKERLDFDLLRPAVEYLWWLVKDDRKDATAVNREFLDWLARRRQPERPFFGLLNFYDAHYPYELPTMGIHRFGVRPRNAREVDLIRDWLLLIQRGPSERQTAFVRDAYDDCIADLDERLGLLIDELQRRGALERTWVIITSDHGESFGEHPGIFCHGMSLYQTELHVPLVIIPPGSSPSPRIITRTVSLRDLPATVADVLGFKAGSPFPGASLARFWDGPASGSPDPEAPGHALAEVVPLESFSRAPSQSLAPTWPLAALVEGDWSYIRRDGTVREELFHLREDPGESHNLAGDPAGQLPLQRMRETLRRLTGGPLTPRRFRP